MSLKFPILYSSRRFQQHAKLSRKILLLAVAAGLTLLSSACANRQVTERNLGPSPLAGSGPDLKKAPEPTAEEYIAQGDTAFDRGDYEKAIVQYVNSLVGKPANADVLVKIATAHLRVGSYVVAQKTFTEVLAQNPKNVEALEGLGLVQMNQQRYDEAVVHLTEALAIEPNRWRALNGLGIMADVGGDLEKAKPYYLQALNGNPRSPELLNNLGYSYYLSGDLTAAELYFVKATDADAKNEKAWSNLGLLHARQRHYRESLDAFSKVMDKAKSLNSVGYICLVSGDYECAEQYFTQAVSASPQWFKEAADNLDKVRALRQSK